MIKETDKNQHKNSVGSALEGRIKGINSEIKRNELNVFQKNKQPLRGVAEEGEGGNIMQRRKKIFAKHKVQLTITNSQCP